MNQSMFNQFFSTFLNMDESTDNITDFIDVWLYSVADDLTHECQISVYLDLVVQKVAMEFIQV